MVAAVPPDSQHTDLTKSWLSVVKQTTDSGPFWLQVTRRQARDSQKLQDSWLACRGAKVASIWTRLVILQVGF